MIEFKINDYLTEVKAELSAVIDKKDKLLLVSPTESGKTRFVLEYIKDNPNKRIALLTPTQSLTDNIARDIDNLRCGYGTDFIHSLDDNESFVSTWDSLANNYFIKHKLDIVFIDEAHLISGHSGFRSVCKTILEYNGKIVFMTGTPEVIERLPMFSNNTLVIKKKNIVKREYNIIKTENKPIDTAKKIIRNLDTKKLTIIRINNKDLLKEIYDCYCKTYKVALYYSDERESKELENIQGEKLYESIKKGNIPKDVNLLLATSIVDAGLTLKVEKEVECHAISNYYMPNAIDMCQLAYRVRSEQGILKLNIYGEFGDDDVEDYEIKAKNLSITIKLLELYYNNYSNINYHQYVGLLEHYGLMLDREITEEKIQTKKKSRVSDYEIIMNLEDSFNKEYNYIKNHCLINDKEEWLNILQPTKQIKTNGSAKLIGIRTKLLKAIDNNIHFSFILCNKKFLKKRLDNLVNVTSNYRCNLTFKSLVDEVIVNYYNKASNVKIDNFANRFNNLNTLQMDSLKTFTSLLYKVDRYDRTRLSLNSINRYYKEEYIKLYLYSFYEEPKLVS